METMEKDWHFFIAIAEEGNVTKAANRLYISQPALSYRLQQLEKQFNKPLFIRTSRGVTLTETGELYYHYALDMLHRKREFENTLSNYSDEITGTLRLGVSSIYANYMLPDILSGFTRAYPKVKLKVYTGISSKIAQLFQSNEVEVAIIRGPQSIDGESLLIHTDRIGLVTNTSLPSKPMPREDILTLPFIRYATAHDLYTIIDKWWKQHYQVPPNDSIKVDTMATCRQFIRKNLGWSVLPETGLGRFSDEFTFEPLLWEDGTPLLRETKLYYQANALQRRAVHTFITYIKNNID